MQQKIKIYHKGDTIIEVMLAITIFSLVIVSSLAVMNQGLYTAQRSLEISLVRSQIDAQAEALRFLNASYISAYKNESTDYGDTPAGQWASIIDKIKDNESVSDFNTVGASCPSIDNAASFIIDTKAAKFVENQITNPTTFSRVVYDNNGVFSKAEGIWIEAIRSNIAGGHNQDNAGYIDFHIRACWDSPGQSVPVILGTIVRLYEPRD